MCIRDSVCAGGPCAYNCEPLADFLDFVMMGEGEEVICEVMEAVSYTHLDVYKRQALACGLKSWGFHAIATAGFKEAQVCCGGIRTDEINPLTMESKICKGLFIAGEIMDIDGDCGGYNLQWAWTSGAAAGLHI